MYNIYQYEQEVRKEQVIRTRENKYTEWMNQHEEMKEIASIKVRDRMKKFIQQQSVSPRALEDDHYQTWRYRKPYRDIEDPKKFLGFKAFKHKPSRQMNQFFNERERKQIQDMADKSKKLVQSQIIPLEQLNRSLRSQGPLNSKHMFRDRKKDKEYLQPKMRYQSITDKDRRDSLHSFDSRFKSIYQSFHTTKSKVGSIRISQMNPTFENKFDLVSQIQWENQPNPLYQFQLPSLDAPDQQRTSEKKQVSSQDMKSKTYFKGAKTSSLFGNKQAEKMLISTQYNRKKDLTNLQHNRKNENCKKSPVV